MNKIEKALRAIAEQIVADVDEVSATGEHDLFYMRMVCNAEDLQNALTETGELLPNKLL